MFGEETRDLQLDEGVGNSGLGFPIHTPTKAKVHYSTSPQEKKRMNPPTLGRFILEPGGVKSNRNWAFHRIARIKWETVCLPKEQGGLGLEDINTFNLALLDKWK